MDASDRVRRDLSRLGDDEVPDVEGSEIATGQTGVAPFPLPILRIVALAELAGVCGLLLPWATGIARALTPAAAACLAVFMVGAAVSHASLRELRQVLFVNLPLLMALVAIVLIRVPEL